MIKYYATRLIFLASIDLFAAENSLKLIRTLPVKHHQEDSDSLYYFFRWLDNQNIFTYKMGKNKRVWDITTRDKPMHVTRDSDYWTQAKKLFTAQSFNNQLHKEISAKTTMFLDQQTYNKRNQSFIGQLLSVFFGKEKMELDGFKVYGYQPQRERLYLRPDGEQYVLIELEKPPKGAYYAQETLSINAIKPEKIITAFKTQTMEAGIYPTIPSLKFDWSPDSQKFALVDTYHPWDSTIQQITIGPEDVNIYETDTFTIEKSFTVETGCIKELSFSPNSRWLAAYSDNIYSSKEKTIRVWDLIHGYLAATIKDTHYGKRNPCNGTEVTPLNAVWSPDGTKIAAYNAEGNINVYQLPQD